MPIDTSPNTTLYTLGRGVLSIGEWSGTNPPGSLTDVGNCPKMEVEVTEEKLNHFSSRTGLRQKDKSVVLETGFTLNFDLDEISVLNLQTYLKARLSGSNVLLANMVTGMEHQIKFVSDNSVGPNETWDFWRLELSPNGAFSLIGEEWSTLSFTGEGLSDITYHSTSTFFTVTFGTTTTTTSTTSTTTTA